MRKRPLVTRLKEARDKVVQLEKRQEYEKLRDEVARRSPRRKKVR